MGRGSGCRWCLQVAVIYVPFLQHAFSTVSLSFERLAALRGGGQLGAVAARIEQGRETCDGQASHGALR